MAIAVDVRSAGSLPHLLPLLEAAARRRRRSCARSFSTRPPTRWCAASPRSRRAAPAGRARQREAAARVDAIELERELLAELREVVDGDRHQPAAPGAAAGLDARPGRAPPTARSRWCSRPSPSSTACRSTPISCSTCACCPTRTTSASCAPLTGRDRAVAAYLRAQPEAFEMLSQIEAFLRALAAALRARPAQLPHGGHRLHRRPAPLGVLRRALAQRFASRVGHS